MLKYLLRRLLVMVPTLFAIMLLSFMISRNVPGDPVLTELDQTSRPGAFISREAQSKAYAEIRHRMGLDLPMFYFSLQPLAYPDTLYRIVDMGERENLSDLVSRNGNWEEIQQYYRAVCTAEEKAARLIVPPNEKEIVDPARLAFSELRKLSDPSEIKYRFDLIDSALVQSAYFSFELSEKYRLCKSSYQQMQATKGSWKLYVPKLTFYGFQNQFHHWLGTLIRLDFGKSYVDKRKVIDKIKDAMPWTIFMGFFSFFISYAIAIPIGVWSVQKRNQWQDKAITVSIFLMYSIPSFVAAMFMMTFLCNPEYFYLFPTTGIASDNAENWPLFYRITDHIWHLTLPTIAYSYGGIAFVSRQMRAGMLETVNMDFIRTARAKGLSERTVIWKHAFRNSILPILTNFSDFLPHLIGGSLIIETIFSIPGMGRLTILSISAYDHPVLLALFTLSAIATLFGILITDILYALVDPRITFSKVK